MAVLQKGKSQEVFWGGKNSFITGLDPLGHQNSSWAVYSQYMPGLTNLTNRIRYYGFYCWLLDHYGQEIRNDSKQVQFNFIRKAEFQLALIMRSANPKFGQVNGSQYADELLKEHEGPVFDLETPAVQADGRRTYWKYASGAFGQYYAGAMKDLKLLVEKDKGYYICTPQVREGISGKELSDCYTASVSPKARELFLSNLERGELKEEDIPFLHSELGLDQLGKKPLEREKYTELLLGPDSPYGAEEHLETEELSFHRSNTTMKLLTYLRDNQPEKGWWQFVWSNYHSCWRELPADEESLAWYVFKVNELWHYSSGAALWGTLGKLADEENGEAQFDRFVESCVETILENLSLKYGLSPDSSIEDCLSRLNLTSEEVMQELDDSINKDRSGFSNALTVSMLGVLILFKENRANMADLVEYADRRNITREGYPWKAINMEGRTGESLTHFVRSFLRREVLSRHQVVAYRKMGNGSRSTLKFHLEENIIRLENIFPPAYSAPRLGALENMLTDLCLIENGEVTSRGLALIQSGHGNS